MNKFKRKINEIKNNYVDGYFKNFKSNFNKDVLNDAKDKLSAKNKQIISYTKKEISKIKNNKKVERVISKSVSYGTYKMSTLRKKENSGQFTRSLVNRRNKINNKKDYIRNKYNSNNLKRVPRKLTDNKLYKKSVSSYKILSKKGINIKKSAAKSTIKKTRLRKILNFFFYLMMVGSLVVAGIIAYWYTTADIPSLNNLTSAKLAQSTKIYDRTGKHLLYDFHGDERRTSAKIENISKHLLDATVAVEDKDFYKHNGFILKSFVKAAYQNVVAGKIVRGASTITQQVVKNYVLTKEKTYDRKAKEIILAIKLDKAKSKEEILEMYLNQIPYGGQIYGIEEAARVYFGKPAADLTVLESAYLAGMPQAPSKFSPYVSNNRKALEERKDMILDLMFEQGYIDEKELDDARSSEVAFLPLGRSNNMRAPHFTNYVISKLKKMYPGKELFTDGFKVITTLNWEMHKELEDALAKEKDRFKRYRASNAASVTVDVRTGEILSMLGSINFNDDKIDGQTNVVISRRQIGSTAKPFAYAELINQGYSPNTILWDVPTQFNLGCKASARNQGPCYRPLNYGGIGNISGPISLKKALVRSLNIPAVKVIYLAGLKEVYNLSQKMGLNIEKGYSHYGLSMVLGSTELRLLDLVSAYGVFGNDGKKNNAVSIKKIMDMSGEEVYKMENPKQEQVLKKNTARVINDMLTSHSQSANIYFSNKKIAVKTGTTNDYKDVLTVGYDSKVVMGMWAGNNNAKSMTSNSSSTVIAPVWKRLMNIVNKYYTPKTFTRPSYGYAVKNKMMLNGSWKISRETTINGSSVGYVTGHNILHYINKVNIKNRSPSNPYNSDKAYRNWEYGVQNWLNNNSYNKKNIKVVTEEQIDDAVNNTDNNTDSNADNNVDNNTDSNTDNNADNNADNNTDNNVEQPSALNVNNSNKAPEKSKKKIKLSVTTSRLTNLNKKDTIKINITLSGSSIKKTSYFVNSKRVSGGKSNLTMNLSTFLGLKESNTIQVKVVDENNKIHEKNFVFTIKE